MTGSSVPHVLILGGTSDARKLAALIHADFEDRVQLTTSLAGRTLSPANMAGNVRTGGFGGVDGLIDYLETENITALIDATHPFATNISLHALTAADETGIPRVLIARPRWSLPEALDLKRVPDTHTAADLLGKMDAHRVLLTTGIQTLKDFSSVPDVWFLVRQIENHEAPLPLSNAATVTQKPPFTLEGERDLMTENRIDTLITKESGGAATEAKLTAATELGVCTILIERPPAPPGDQVTSPEDALAWLHDCLGRKT